MQDRHLQMLLSSVDEYIGGIDGTFGQLSIAAVLAVEMRMTDSYTFDPNTTTEHRRKTACAQACLNILGHDAGLVDGWMGVNTTEALNAYLFVVTNKRPEVITRAPAPDFNPSTTIPHQDDVNAVYGDPESQVPNRLTRIELPFKLRIDYNMRQSTNKITVHRDCAASLEAALIAVHAHYGMAEMERLGLHRYAGAYHKRKMRGSSRWSMHAYGCAIDFYAELNGLRTACPEALFCGAQYQPFLDIMQDHEWLPAIRLWGKDAMHFQRARL